MLASLYLWPTNESGSLNTSVSDSQLNQLTPRQENGILHSAKNRQCSKDTKPNTEARIWMEDSPFLNTRCFFVDGGVKPLSKGLPGITASIQVSSGESKVGHVT